MVLPILAYGHPMLRQNCEEIPVGHPVQSLIDNMWETLYAADGCGLAASQVGMPVKLFLVDSKLLFDQMNPESRLVYFEDNSGIKEAFLNAKITACSGRQWLSDEACLSIPGLQYGAERPWAITVEYLDESFKQHKTTFSGITARMIQHEYEHTLGILYLDHLSSSTRKRISRKLEKISRGAVKTKYPMQFFGRPV